MPTCLRTRLAEEDLIELWLHVATENPHAADRLLDRIEALCELLSHYPAMGAGRPDLAPGLRYAIAGSHLIL